jgi:hypothetical protein
VYDVCIDGPYQSNESLDKTKVVMTSLFDDVNVGAAASCLFQVDAARQGANMNLISEGWLGGCKKSELPLRSSTAEAWDEMKNSHPNT